MKVQNLTKKKPRYKILSIMLIFIIIFMGSITPGNSAHIEEDDPEDDLYKITMLDFLYVIGDTMPDRPDSKEELEELIEKMVLRSEESTRPSCIDIREICINTDDPNWIALIVEMEGDIDDCDYVQIIGFMEDEDDDWIGFIMEYDSGSTDYSWESEDHDNDTVGGCSGNQIGIALPKSECNWHEDDTLILISMTYSGDFDRPTNSLVFYDIWPNSMIPEETTQYQGEEPITQFLSEIAEFLFGWLLPGHIPFLLLIAFLLFFSQLLFDRKNRYAHYIGLACLLFMLYPIFFYSIQLNLVGIMGLPNVFSISTLIALLWFASFSCLSILNGFGVFKRYKFAFVSGMISMITQEIIYLAILMDNQHIIALFFLAGITIGLTALLIISKRYGRNNKFK